MNYKLLYSGNQSLDLAIINYLAKKNIEFIYKNNSIYISENIYREISHMECFYKIPLEIKRMFDNDVPDEIKNMYLMKRERIISNFPFENFIVKYYAIKNNIKLAYYYKDNVFDQYQELKNLFTINKFEIKEQNYYSEKFISVLFFQGDIYNGIYNLLANIYNLNEFKENFSGIFFDYNIANDKIIYEFVFEYNEENKKRCLEEINRFKNRIIKLKGEKLNNYINQGIYTNFEEDFLYKYKTMNKAPFLEFISEKVYLPPMEKVI
ncbi:hypothetical protein Marpi_0912 [Marinitoga piezophila KA3]|uniref:Uncharacterized protein n=1 Tax=Marinitoga piezophila (strain DSM 14283 / JCM 11233 / KA3) TaxID=443254 RepID=H2J7D5_MARPK|nr:MULTISPECIES: hypothetical protein [Marinitoga]AEX85327.1 hypothetical protein Marpi_0912 [Marinitoga piezophila KA3]APT75811.1 hypothetical protein LN42_05005 [Marinitoga sp. 1137]